MLERMLQSSRLLDVNDLCIVPGKFCWVLYIDVMVVQYGGNLVDVATLGIYSALRDTHIPKVVAEDQSTKSKDALGYELDDDVNSAWKLDVDCCPICVTLSQITPDSSFYVLDASHQEEGCTCSTLVVGVDSTGTVCGLQKGGSGTFDPDALSSMMRTCVQTADKLFTAVKGIIETEEGKGANFMQKSGFF
jgi:exosome complex component RRP42